MLAVIDNRETWLIVAIGGSWLVLMAFRIIGIDLMYAMAWHHLRVQAHQLRLEQYERIQAMMGRAVHEEAARRGIGTTAGGAAATTTAEADDDAEDATPIAA